MKAQVGAFNQEKALVGALWYEPSPSHGPSFEALLYTCRYLVHVTLSGMPAIILIFWVEGTFYYGNVVSWIIDKDPSKQGSTQTLTTVTVLYIKFGHRGYCLSVSLLTININFTSIVSGVSWQVFSNSNINVQINTHNIQRRHCSNAFTGAHTVFTNKVTLSL